MPVSQLVAARMNPPQAQTSGVCGAGVALRSAMMDRYIAPKRVTIKRRAGNVQ